MFVLDKWNPSPGTGIMPSKLVMLEENQNSFRQKGATSDATQVMIRIHGGMDFIKRRSRGLCILENEADPEGSLLDLKNVYRRVSKQSLWQVLRMERLKGQFFKLSDRPS